MASEKEQKKSDSRTGKYVYDAKLGKVVKVSDDIPGLKKGSSAQGGGCPINPGGHTCGGGCGCGG